MKRSTNYNLPLPEGDDEMLIEEVSEGIGKLDEQLGTTDKKISDHLEDKTNPHGVTKSQLGLGNVENKSSATIRGELTQTNVTNALGYTPANSSHSHSISSIPGLEDRLQLIEDILNATVHKLQINYTLVGSTTHTSSSGDTYTTYTFNISAYNDSRLILTDNNHSVDVASNSSLVPYIDSYNGEDSIVISLGIKMNGYKEPWYGHSIWYALPHAYESYTLTIYYSPSSEEGENADILKVIDE